jgi:hypothetical protein
MLKTLTLGLFLAVLVVAPARADEWRVDNVDRVVAISDVHGAYDAMVETLRNVDILDAELAWTGGTSHLVIVGDLLDRGPRSRDAMDLLMRLEAEAQAAGGRVHVLIGNHESMNMIGDLRYVSKEEYAAFAGEETPEVRERWLAAWAERNNSDAESLRSRFDSTFPAGYFALRSALSAEGKYGKWLLSKNVVAVINGTAFVHGGLPPELADIGLAGINEGLKQEMADYVRAVDTLIEAEVLLPTDNYYDHESIVNNYAPSLSAAREVIDAVATVTKLADASLFTPEGPLWYRGNVSCSAIIEGHRLDAALQAIGANRVVVGHTPTPNRKVLERLNGRIVEVDTGMLNFYYKGSGNALVMEGSELKVYNQSGAEAYAPIEHPRRVGKRQGNLSADELQTLLETGEIVSENEDGETGRTLVSVSDGAHTVSAIFNKRRSRGFYPDVAAYRLDRLLQLDMVPVTVMRTVGKDEGSLQFLPERISDEGQRSASGQGGGASCALPLQWEAMYVFDILIYNEGRSLQRMVYEPSAWNLILIEHERAFKNSKGRPPHLSSASIKVSEGWRKALRALDDTVLEENFADVLDKKRLKSLGTRRDQLIAE